MNTYNQSFNGARDFMLWCAGGLWAFTLYVILPLLALTIFALIAAGFNEAMNNRANTKPVERKPNREEEGTKL